MELWEQPLSRRRFLGAAAAAAVGARPLARAALGGSAKLPPPGRSGIDHVIVVMMENRSFDHLLGWLPGADGKQAGLSYTDAAGASHPTHRARARLPGLRLQRPRPLATTARASSGTTARATAGCAPVANDLYSIGYYRQQDLPSSARSRRRSRRATASSRRSSARRSRTASTRSRASPTARATSSRASTCRRSSTASPRRRCPLRTTTATSPSCSSTSATTRSRTRTR